MVRPVTLSERSPQDCAFCTCLDPRFDVVTLKNGERHSEFCCVCGRPGLGDAVSGRPEVDMPEHFEAPLPGEVYVRSGDRWRKATVADEQRMLSHYALTGEWPGWCSCGTQPPLPHVAEPRSPARFRRVWKSFPDYDAILGIESATIAEVLPPAPAPGPLFDHKTAPKIEAESRSGPLLSLAWRRGSGRFQVGDSTWYVGVDLAFGGDQGKTVFAHREANGSVMVEAIDDTPPAGWTQSEIYERLRAIYERAKQGEVNVSDVSTEKDREQGVMRANVTMRAPLPAIKTPLAWTWPCDFTVPSSSSENAPSLYIAKAKSKTDGPSYRFSWESPPSTPPSTTEINASTFAYAPGERDAYPVGQAPGEAARWSEILASTPRGPK